MLSILKFVVNLAGSLWDPIVNYSNNTFLQDKDGILSTALPTPKGNNRMSTNGEISVFIILANVITYIFLCTIQICEWTMSEDELQH